MAKDIDMDKPLPGASDTSSDAKSSAIEVKQISGQKLGSIIQETGSMMEMLVATGIINDGDDVFKSLASIMANSQTALDSLNGEMKASISTPNVAVNSV